MDGGLVAEYFKLRNVFGTKEKIRFIAFFFLTRGGKIDLMAGEILSVLYILL